MKQIIDGKMYNTDTAELVADNEFNDGNNRFSHGTASYLYKTKKGNFFTQYLTQWQGDHDNISPINVEQAKQTYEDLRNHNMEYEEAFGEKPEEA
jgi:hypothetical protein